MLTACDSPVLFLEAIATLNLASWSESSENFFQCWLCADFLSLVVHCIWISLCFFEERTCHTCVLTWLSISYTIWCFKFILLHILDIHMQMCNTFSEFWSDFSNWNNSDFSDFIKKCIFILENEDIKLIFCACKGTIVMHNTLQDLDVWYSNLSWKVCFIVGGGGWTYIIRGLSPLLNLFSVFFFILLEHIYINVDMHNTLRLFINF